MSRYRSQMQFADQFQSLVSPKTLFLFWWTNKHTCTPEETVCQYPVACCVTAQFALPNPTGTGKDGINHYCPLPYTINQRDRATGNELRLVSDSRWESCLLFCRILWRNLLRTHNIVTLILSWRFLCQGRMSAQPGMGSSQHVMLVKPYCSVKYDFSSSGPFRGEHWWPVSVCRILTCK